MNMQLFWIGLLANGVGAVIVLAFIGIGAPGALSDEEWDRALIRSLIGFVFFMAVALPFGRWWAASKPFEPIREWLDAERPATDAERRLVLRYPWIWTIRSAVIWVVGAVLFAVLNADIGALNAIGLIVTVTMGGLTACALQYLMVDWRIRPITALALAHGQPERLETPGVATRLAAAWALGTGVALLGIVSFAVGDFVGPVEIDHGRLVGAILFLAASGILAGAAAMLLAGRSLVDSLAGLRGALERIEKRDFDARVDVNDGSEIGLLQAGFNKMAAGLAERERIRDAFGAYVDPEVAEHILEEGTDLAGETVEATILFADVRDFTQWSERVTAPEVVATLNRLFSKLVPVIHEHGGHVDKFVGDGLMAVFGAPRRQDDHADCALKTAMAIEELVEGEFAPDLRVGIGLNSGAVVAGNVGGAGRLDFSVIGDPVNVAARVEAATRETGDTILMTAETCRRLNDSGVKLEPRPAIPFKGKREPVELFAPEPARTAS